MKLILAVFLPVLSASLLVVGDDDTYLTIYEANRKTGVMVIKQFVSTAGSNETELVSRKVYDCENSDNMPNKF